MNVSPAYALQELPKGFPLRESRRRLVLRGAPTAFVVNGDEMGLQMESGRLMLLATSYDYFDGCQHWIHLLKDGRPVDQLRMPDEFGFIQDVVTVSEHEVSFGDFGTNDRWHLVADEHGFWSYAVASLRRRLNRFLLARRHVSVRCTKGPPWSLDEAAPGASAEGTSPRSQERPRR